MNPFAIGAGAMVASGTAVGFGATRIADGIAREHPTGSDADKPSARVFWGSGALGLGAMVGGMVALWRGNITAGAALVGGGAGVMLGSLGAGFAFTARHGIGVETSVENVLGAYDADDNGQLDLTDRGWTRPAETTRTVTTSWRDAQGHTHFDTDEYSVERLAERADRDDDQIATRGELTGTIDSYDADGNGRLQGDELKRFNRELGERQLR